MTRPRFPTHEAEDRLRAGRARGVEPVALHGTPSPIPAAHVQEAVAAALGGPQHAPPPRGLVELRATLAAEIGRAGREVDPETDVVVTNGAMHALALCFRALLEPGDEVVVPGPCFFFAGPVEAAGGVCTVVPGAFGDGWAWDADALAAAVGPRTRALLLCNPGNPTGRVHGRDELAAAVGVAERHGLVVVTDEAYEAAVYGEARVASAFAATEHCVVVRSLGKSLSLPQLRLGAVVGPRDLIDAVAVELEWDVLRVGLPQQVAAIAALQGPRDWLDDVRKGLERDRDAALAIVERVPALRVVAPAGGPFLFLGEAPGLADALLACGLPVVDGRHFHAPGWARLPFGGAAAAAAELEAALARWGDGTAG